MMLFATAMSGSAVDCRRTADSGSDATYWQRLKRGLDAFQRQRSIAAKPQAAPDVDDGIRVYADSEMPDMLATLETDMPDITAETEIGPVRRRWKLRECRAIDVDAIPPSELAAAGWFDSTARDGLYCGDDMETIVCHLRHYFDRMFRVLRPIRAQAIGGDGPNVTYVATTAISYAPPTVAPDLTHPLPRNRVLERGADWSIPGAAARDMAAERPGQFIRQRQFVDGAFVDCDWRQIVRQRWLDKIERMASLAIEIQDEMSYLQALSAACGS